MDAVGRLFDLGLESTPAFAQFRGALGIGEGGRVEEVAVDAAEDVAEGDFRGRTAETVAPVLAAGRADNAMRLQFEEDLDEVTRGQVVFGGDLLETRGLGLIEAPGQRENGAGGVIAFDGQLHGDQTRAASTRAH